MLNLDFCRIYVDILQNGSLPYEGISTSEDHHFHLVAVGLEENSVYLRNPDTSSEKSTSNHYTQSFSHESTYSMVENQKGVITLNGDQYGPTRRHFWDVYIATFLLGIQIMIIIFQNITGICILYPSEKSQRNAFLETRSCVKARLAMQRENQQQVRLFSTV